MKAFVFIVCLVCTAIPVLSQQTYYWVGGVGPAVFHGSSANWNTMQNGSGTARSTPLTTDILIIDGTNIGGAVPTTGTVNATAATHSFGQFILQNNADVVLQRVSAGTGNLTISGGTGDDLSIEAGSTLTLTSNNASMGLTITMATGTTGNVAGTVRILDNNLFTARLYVKDVNALNFNSGSKCYVNNQVAGNYPFGQLSTPVATGGINFKSGSELIYQGGVNPYSSSTFVPFYFEKGSTLVFEATNAANMLANHTLANVTVRNNTTINGENFYNIDTLNVNAGSTFYLRATGGSPFSGDVINNGTLGAAAGFTTTIFILNGTVPQTVGGSGTYTDIGTLSVATDADVTLNTSLYVGGISTSIISGKLNTQTNVIAGIGNFQLRPSASITSAGTLTSGSNTVSLDPAVFATGINTANVAIGMLVTATGVPANTYIIATNSAGSSFTISKAATISSAPLGASINISNNPATLATANSGGVDGAILTTATRTFATGTHYIFNAATSAPFTTSSSNVTGNVTFNAAATTNKTSQSIGGTLTLNAGKLTIRSTDQLRITSGNAIGGGPFSNSKYIVSAVAGNNLGVLRIDNLPTTTTLFPVGTSNYYLPVTVTPASTSDHSVSVFEGVTEDGTPTGTAFSAAKKSNVVDAVWVIDRPTGSGNCIINLQWNAALEGSAFAGYSNANIGISHYDGPLWGLCLGTGDNTANNATAMYSTFSPFGVGFNNTILASQVKNISATIKTNGVEINWNVANEAGIQLYEIEKSLNRVDFIKIGSVNASGISAYRFTDLTTVSGIIYYRLKIIGLSGDVKYTEIVIVKKNTGTDINLYPNPAVNNVVLSGLSGHSLYRIMNTTGQVVVQQNTTASSLSIDVSGLPGGLYFIEIVPANDKPVRRSFIKK